MRNDRADYVRPPYHALRLIWDALRLILVVLRFTATVILGLMGLSTIFVNVVLIIVPLIAFYRGQPWGHTGVHPLFISLAATLVFVFLVAMAPGRGRKTDKKIPGIEPSKENDQEGR
jgi:uncharacterized membrane protein